MKKIRLLLFILLSCLGVANLQAQDIHFTMYNMSPLTLNPANTGAFLGTVRIGGIYRSQWTDNIYQTPSLYADAPILAIGKKKRDWIGVGAAFLNDRAGTEVKLRTSFFMLSGAFHKVLDKKSNHILTLGVQGGTMSRSLETRFLVFEDQLQNTGLNQSEDLGLFNEQRNERTGENEGVADFPSYSAGLLLTSKINEDVNLRVGLVGNHLVNLGNDYALTGTSQSSQDSTVTSIDRDAPERKRPATLKFHTTVDYKINDQFSLHPSAFFQTTKGLTEVIAQVPVGYQFNKDLQLLLGPSMRLGDSFNMIGGAQYKDLSVRASYDFTTSALANNARIRNGFEIAASYIIKIYKEPQVNPKILCPKF